MSDGFTPNGVKRLYHDLEAKEEFSLSAAAVFFHIITSKPKSTTFWRTAGFLYVFERNENK